jgi:hypothetical protein
MFCCYAMCSQRLPTARKKSKKPCVTPWKRAIHLLWAENVLGVVLLRARSHHHSFCSKMVHKIQPSHMTINGCLLRCGDGETTICSWLIGQVSYFFQKNNDALPPVPCPSYSVV